MEPGESNRPDSADSSRNLAGSPAGDAKSDAVVADPVLRQLLEVWPTLPEAIKAGILAMIGVARG